MVPLKKSDADFLYWDALATLPRYQHSYRFLHQHFNQNDDVIGQWFDLTQLFGDANNEQARLYNVSLLKIAKFVTNSLNDVPLFRQATQITKEITHCIRLGFYALNHQTTYPVLLGVAIEEGELETIIKGLFMQESPSLLLLPSSDAVSQTVLHAVNARGSQIISLQQWQTERSLIDNEQVINTFNAFVKAPTKSHHTANTNNATQFSIPAGAKWQDITFQFTNGHTVRITYDYQGQFVSDTFHYSQMQMVDKRNDTPNQLWAALKLLAANKGQLIWPNRFATSQQKWLKHQLVKALQHHCNIYTDPFASIRDDAGCSGYQALFTILTEG